jgi:hypothetical protein
MDKFGNLTPNSIASQVLTPNSTTLQKLTPWARILSKRGTQLIFYHIPYIWHCLLLWREQIAPDLSTHESQAVEKGTLDRVSCSNRYGATKKENKRCQPSLSRRRTRRNLASPAAASMSPPTTQVCLPSASLPPCWSASPPCSSCR